MLQQLLQRIQQGDLSGLAGSNLALELPIAEALFQQLMDARPADSPLETLEFAFLEDNRALVHLAARVPVLGKVSRKLSLKIGGEYERSQSGLLHFEIVDGLKMLDKPIISLLQNQVEKRLPAGIDLNARIITIDLPKLLRALGQEHLLGLIAGAKLGCRQEKLLLYLHLQPLTES